VDRQVTRQRNKDAMKARQEYDRQADIEHAKREKFANLTTLKGLGKNEYMEMRKQDFYAMPRNSEDPMFHRKEQELIFKEYYANLK